MQKVRRHPFSHGKPCEHRAPTACKCMVSGTFDSAHGCAFHRSIALLVHYRSSRSIQPWAVVRPDSREVSRVSRYSGTPLNGDLSVSRTGLSPSVVRLSRLFRYQRFCNPSRRPQPRDESRFGLFPLSLAATDGIDVSFLSSRYLDVSVPWVRSLPSMNSTAGDCEVVAAAFPHSEISGSMLDCQLPGAYRRLPRLSSPLDAKTSTIHP